MAKQKIIPATIWHYATCDYCGFKSNSYSDIDNQKIGEEMAKHVFENHPEWKPAIFN